MTDVFFLETVLEFERRNPERQVTQAYVLNNLIRGLRLLFGQVGAAHPLDILRFGYDPAGAGRVDLLLCCPAGSAAVKVRASLALQCTYQGEPCAYTVTAAGHSLLQLQKQNP